MAARAPFTDAATTREISFSAFFTSSRSAAAA
jgi:hypothetical protein